jgi:hypothetical protein
MKLVSREERGQPGWKLPGDTESNGIDSGVLATLVPYENVTLAMYGKKIALTDRNMSAILSWNNPQCKRKMR